ncbi:MAG: hypothetical protein ACK502_10680 [Alphaproteobacteria bacterium]|jgi:hypothetical protein
MSLDEQYEQELYDAISRIITLPRPVQRERILKNAVMGIMVAMNWNSVTTELEKQEEKPNESARQ